MSHTTETIHVRGVKRARVVEAITRRMRGFGYVPVGFLERTHAEATEAELRRIVLRRDGRWITLADADGFDQRLAAAAPGADLESWGRDLSRALERSVLTIWTWDGEACVRATRWKKGRSRGVLSLLDDAYLGADGLPYAPAKIFRPWLDTQEIKLIAPPGGSTGDAEIDAMLEGFDDADRIESVAADGRVFVSEDVSVRAIADAIGMKRPALNPYMLDDGDAELLFRPARS